jgi:transcriptional regulator with XRE-family HTH domain
MLKVAKIIAENMIRMREDRDWNQDALAARAGVARETISRLESKKYNFSADSLSAIAAAFGVSEPEMITDPDDISVRKPDLNQSLQNIISAVSILLQVPPDILSQLQLVNWNNKEVAITVKDFLMALQVERAPTRSQKIKKKKKAG